MSRITKIWEKVIEYRLRQNVTITENRFGFIPKRLTIEWGRHLMEIYRARKKDLYMVLLIMKRLMMELRERCFGGF